MNNTKTVISWLELYIFLVIALSEYVFSAAVISAFLIHEISHIAVCYALGGKIRSIKPAVCGLKISYGPSVMSYSRELAVIFAGSVVNLLVGFACVAVMPSPFAYVNISLGAVNIIPVKGLDGGAAVYTAISYFAGEKRAERAVGIISVICSVCLWLATVYCQLRISINIGILMTAVYVMLSVLIN